MHLGNLKPKKGAIKNRKRIGRGPGSGHGSTSTRGNKGAKSRGGYSAHHWFEGGQMPLKRRVPKRGFTNVHAAAAESVNLRDLEKLKAVEITKDVLVLAGLVHKDSRLKVLGGGEITRAITLRCDGVSAGARQKIEAAGGKVEIVPKPTRPKRYAKKAREKTGKSAGSGT